MMMAMLRLNIPSIFVYGGSILPGRYQDRDVTVVDVFEIVGKYAAGTCPIEDVHALEKVACPGHGACGGQYTANTMACVAEAIGLSLPNSRRQSSLGHRAPSGTTAHDMGSTFAAQGSSTLGLNWASNRT